MIHNPALRIKALERELQKAERRAETLRRRIAKAVNEAAKPETDKTS